LRGHEQPVPHARLPAACVGRFAKNEWLRSVTHDGHAATRIDRHGFGGRRVDAYRGPLPGPREPRAANGRHGEPNRVEIVQRQIGRDGRKLETERPANPRAAIDRPADGTDDFEQRPELRSRQQLRAGNRTGRWRWRRLHLYVSCPIADRNRLACAATLEAFDFGIRIEDHRLDRRIRPDRERRSGDSDSPDVPECLDRSLLERLGPLKQAVLDRDPPAVGQDDRG
jgi:hypothetical protein